MTEREELIALRRLGELEAKERAVTISKNEPDPSEGRLPFRPFGIDSGLTMPQGVSRFMAGAGAGMTNLARGSGQTLGLVDQKDIADAKKRDAPLMATGAGISGNIAGNVAAMLPSAFIPGANTLAGSAAIGAVSGLMQPVAEGSVSGGKLKEALFGTVAAPATLLGARGLVGVGRGAKALIEPFRAEGRDAIVGRTLQRFADDPAQAAIAARSAPQLVPGSMPTLAEATLDPGLAQLQRAAQSADPRIGSALANRGLEQNAARTSALGGIAQDATALGAAREGRDSAAQSLYGQAHSSDAMRRELASGEAVRSAGLDYARRGGMGALNTEANTAAAAIKPSPGLQALMKRDSFRSAVDSAKRLAADKGEDLVDPLTSVKGLHYVKLALDDMLETTPSNALGRNAKSAVTSIKSQLVREIESLSPAYGNARQTYQQMSGPINQMEVGQYLLNKMQPALADFGLNTRTKAEAYARALKDAPRTIKGATGSSAQKSLDDLMTPDQMKTLRGIASDLARKAGAEDVGRSIGSNTAQNLASQNILRQLFGPTGMPQSWMESGILRSMARPLDFAYKAVEPNVQGVLGNAMLDPKVAAALLLREQSTSQMGMLGGQAERYLPGMTEGLRP